MPASLSSEIPLAATPFTKRLERRVLAFICRQQMFRPGECSVIAVSGGPDSTALLVLLSRLRAQLDIDITAAHFDHMLRSLGEAAADKAYVEALTITLGVRLICGSGDVPARARRNHGSIEDAARHLRYAFLEEEAAHQNASVVALGHTLADQAETVLLHLLRGSGLDGLVAMRPRSSWPFGRGPNVARPLLCLRRDEAERYCRELRVEPRRDSTNDLPVVTRNRIRHTLLPALREFNPRIEGALVRLAEAASLDTDYLHDAAEDAWQRLAQPRGECVSFARTELAALHPALSARLIRHAVAHILGFGADLEAVHIQTIEDSLRKPRCRFSLPHELTAVLDSGSLTITRGEPQPATPISETALAAPGRTVAGDWMIETQIVAPPPDPDRGDRFEAFLDADAVGDDLTVRSRRPGDRLRPLGLGGEKKVQDILVDRKVPLEERDCVPIVCTRAGIMWVVGHCIDDRYALHQNSRCALHVRFAWLIADI